MGQWMLLLRQKCKESTKLWLQYIVIHYGMLHIAILLPF